MDYRVGYRSEFGECVWLADQEHECNSGEWYTVITLEARVFPESEAWATVQELALGHDVVVVERVEGSEVPSIGMGRGAARRDEGAPGVPSGGPRRAPSEKTSL
ncbi:hypothetical protein ACEK07_49245 [Alcanivoracaceae bacterium MT1]